MCVCVCVSEKRFETFLTRILVSWVLPSPSHHFPVVPCCIYVYIIYYPKITAHCSITCTYHWYVSLSLHFVVLDFVFLICKCFFLLLLSFQFNTRETCVFAPIKVERLQRRLWSVFVEIMFPIIT